MYISQACYRCLPHSGSFWHFQSNPPSPKKYVYNIFKFVTLRNLYYAFANPCFIFVIEIRGQCITAVTVI